MTHSSDPSDFQDSITRGYGYLQYQRWSDAIAEFEQALKLGTPTVELLHSLALAYYHQFQKYQQRSSHQQAIDYAKQCLNLQADYHPALELLNELDRHKPQPNLVVPGILAAIVALVCMGVVFTGISMIERFTASNDGDRPSSPTSSPTTPTTSTPNTSTTGAGEFTIPVVLDASPDAEGLSVDARFSRLSNYPNSSFYELQAVLINDSDQELQELKLQAELLDANEAVIDTDTIEVLRDTATALRPGDRQPFDLLHETTPGIAQVRLTVQLIDQTPAASNYTPSAPIEFDWASGQPANLQISIAERLNQLSTYSTGSSYHSATLEISNTGETAIQSLKLQIDRWDANDQLLDSREIFVVSSSTPNFLPGETWLEYTIREIESSFDRYSITVLEAN